MKYIKLIEICVGLGLGLGPAIGSIVIAHLSYANTMYVFGALNTLGIIICMGFIPNELN